MPVIQHLEQDIEYVRMRFFHFVEKEPRNKGIAPHLLRQLAAVVKANISRRGGTDQLGNGMSLHIFRTYRSDQRIFRSEHGLCQRLAQFCFPNARRSQEQERSDGPLGSWSPTLPRRIARYALTASSWPITAYAVCFPASAAVRFPFPSSLLTGILVHMATTPAMSFSVTSCLLKAFFFSIRAPSSGPAFPTVHPAPGFQTPAWERLQCGWRLLFSNPAPGSSFNFLISSGGSICRKRTAEAALSIKSIALSGGACR